MDAICIIPARGGSKRIPRKNLAPFHGRPMISWSITAARESGLFSRIIVSTDDLEIAEIAKVEGTEVPFLRPSYLADDSTPTVPVIAHAVKELSLGPEVAVCCLYATAPLVQSDDIKAGYGLLQARGYVVTITSFPFPIQRALRISANDHVGMLNPEHMLTRSQDLEEMWHDAGQFYWGRAATWLSGQPIFGEETKGLRLPKYRVQDIDTPEDWVRAEALFDFIKNNK